MGAQKKFFQRKRNHQATKKKLLEEKIKKGISMMPEAKNDRGTGSWWEGRGGVAEMKKKGKRQLEKIKQPGVKKQNRKENLY